MDAEGGCIDFMFLAHPLPCRWIRYWIKIAFSRKKLNFKQNWREDNFMSRCPLVLIFYPRNHDICARHLVDIFVFKMAAGCCGVKKQKLNNSMPSICCNGSAVHPTKTQNGMVIRPDMCFFCFDVLYSHLHSCEPPKTPLFTNEPL